MRSLPIENKPSWHEFDDLAPTVIEHAHLLDKKVCHIAHWINEVDDIRKNFNDVIICKLVNYSKFNLMSFKLKAPNSTDWARHQNGFVSWDKNSYPGDVEFDIDTAMSSRENFLIETKKIYNFLGLEDYQPDYLLPFYTAYMDLHK